MQKSFRKTLHHEYQIFDHQSKCCVCGMTNCEEAVDHLKITLHEFTQILKNRMQNQSEIQDIKKIVSQIYRELKFRIISLLQHDEYQTQSYINKFYFTSHFGQKAKNDLNLIAQILEGNVQKLPSRKISKLVCKMHKNSSNGENTDQFETLREQKDKFVEEFNIEAMLQSLKAGLPLNYFQEEHSKTKLKAKTSISEITNPEETDSVDVQKIYQWQNVKVTQNSRIVSLSNKNISDREVMEQIPRLSNFKNLKEFEIRNNKISCLSCSVIANNMPFLVSVDIRGNKISDKGILKLIRGIPKMKSFFISETLATDLSGEEVADKLPELQMFWSQHTTISNRVALKIAQKPKLKVLSLVGNPLDDEHKQKLKKIFISKGYVAL